MTSSELLWQLTLPQQCLCVCVQEAVTGVIVLVCKEPLQHHGISLSMEGLVNLQLSSKSVGVFEAFYNSVKVNCEPHRVESFQLSLTVS